MCTGGVEGTKEGKKKDLRERSVQCRGERWPGRKVGKFSQLPTLLWILRFKGLLFFLALREKHRKDVGTLATPRNRVVSPASLARARSAALKQEA